MVADLRSNFLFQAYQRVFEFEILNMLFFYINHLSINLYMPYCNGGHMLFTIKSITKYRAYNQNAI